MRQPGVPRRLILAGLCAALAGPAAADFISSHGGVVHLDPFVAGWIPPAGPVPAPPAPGTVVGAPVGGPFTNDIVGSLAIDTKGGVDTLASPAGWHWEIELDFDPYGGVIPPVFIAPLGGGPLIGPFLLAGGAGPDLYIDVHQPDHPAELGKFSKSLINLLPVPVGWGTSVSEDPIAGREPFGKEVCLERLDDDAPIRDSCQVIEEPGLETRKFINVLALVPIFQTDPAGTQTWVGIRIEQRHIPEPASLWLLAIALAALGRSRTKWSKV